MRRGFEGGLVWLLLAPWQLLFRTAALGLAVQCCRLWNPATAWSVKLTSLEMAQAIFEPISAIYVPGEVGMKACLPLVRRILRLPSCRSQCVLEDSCHDAATLRLRSIHVGFRILICLSRGCEVGECMVLGGFGDSSS